ncbi:MAG: hypothetical protein QJR03_00380 [Sphaerobacter sp.]|nr:hypothetical protein [Sphaerobacter sp.]
MSLRSYQVIGRRLSQPQTLLFRDAEGRHFLRADCGSRLIRLTARDAARLLRQYDYHLVLDRAWRTESDALQLGCPWPPAGQAGEATNLDSP